jgi:hypothetical protein
VSSVEPADELSVCMTTIMAFLGMSIAHQALHYLLGKASEDALHIRRSLSFGRFLELRRTERAKSPARCTR